MKFSGVTSIGLLLISGVDVLAAPTKQCAVQVIEITSNPLNIKLVAASTAKTSAVTQPSKSASNFINVVNNLFDNRNTWTKTWTRNNWAHSPTVPPVVPTSTTAQRPPHSSDTVPSDPELLPSGDSYQSMNFVQHYPSRSSTPTVSSATAAQAPSPPDNTVTSNPQPQTTSSGNSYQDTVLYHHNVHRANHSANDLVWNAGLAATALKIAQKCVYGHNTTIDGGGYGQNIAAGIKPADVGQGITNMMYYGEMPNYNAYYGLANPDFKNGTIFGHFTQIVWKATTSVGCATFDCSPSGGLQALDVTTSPYFTVCNFSPAGNMGGEYGANVGRPLGHPTVT